MGNLQGCCTDGETKAMVLDVDGGGLAPAQEDSEEDDALSISSSNSPDVINLNSIASLGMCDFGQERRQMRALHVSKMELEERTASLKARHVPSPSVYTLYVQPHLKACAVT